MRDGLDREVCFRAIRKAARSRGGVFFYFVRVNRAQFRRTIARADACGVFS